MVTDAITKVSKVLTFKGVSADNQVRVSKKKNLSLGTTISTQDHEKPKISFWVQK